MGSPLTLASTVQCGHEGTVVVHSSTKLTVDGKALLIEDGVKDSLVAPLTCKTVVTTTTSKCQTVTSVLPISLATKLTAGGNKVVLDTLVGLTDGVPPGTLLAIAGQTKLTAV